LNIVAYLRASLQTTLLENPFLR